MLKMIFNHTSVERCDPTSPTQSAELQKDCNFFLTAIRLASLNQILDPWVYLLLREILLRKFCQVANAVSNCSNDGHKEQPIILSTEIRKPLA